MSDSGKEPRPSRPSHGRLLLVIAAALIPIGILVVAAVLRDAGTVCAEAQGFAGPELRCALEVAAPPESVWEAFTGTGEPRPYYFDAVLEAELEPGGRWRFVTDDRERLLAGGEVRAVEPPRRFVHSFAAADLDDPPTTITVELEPLAGGATRLTLVHEGFAGRTATYRRFRRAHPLALDAMRAWLERGELPLRARLYTALFKPGMKWFTARAEPWDPAPSPDASPTR